MSRHQLTAEGQPRVYCHPLCLRHCERAWVELAGARADVEAGVHVQPDTLCKTYEPRVERL